MNSDKQTFQMIKRIGVGVLIIGIMSIFWLTRTVPTNFPTGTNFVVDEGESLTSISTRLEEGHYITSALFFRTWISFLGSDRHVQLGVYSFDKPIVLGALIKKLVTGTPDAPLLSVTIPEGSTEAEIASIIQKALPGFSKEIFTKKVEDKHANGKLFPSTYYLLPSYTEERIVDMMVSTFEKKYESAFKDTSFPKPLTTEDDIVSLAAVLEGEAKTPEDMKIVSGILLKRLSINMAIQVDVAKETYTQRGLPKAPINNPGIVALEAAFHPTQSPYLYYLTGKDGIMHYSKTFEEHKKNIQKYLK